MNKKRIAHVLPRSCGGVNTILQNIVSEMVDDYETTVFIVGRYEKMNQVIEKKIQFVRLNQKHFLSFKMIVELIRLIRENDIIHVHLFPALYFCAYLKPFFIEP